MKRTKSHEWDEYGDNFIPIVPVDRLIHTADNPYCDDPDCNCRDGLVDQLNGYYQQGLVSADDATRIIGGKTITGTP